MSEPVKMYTLSTCGHCKAAKKFLRDHGVAHHCTDVDLLTGDERKATIEEVKKYNPACSFPDHSDRREGHRRIQRTGHPGGTRDMTAVEQLYEMLETDPGAEGILFQPGPGEGLRSPGRPPHQPRPLRIHVLSLPSGIRRSRIGPGHHLPLRLSGGGCPRVRQLLLQSLCVRPAWNEGRIPTRLCAGTETAGEIPF